MTATLVKLFAAKAALKIVSQTVSSADTFDESLCDAVIAIMQKSMKLELEGNWDPTGNSFGYKCAGDGVEKFEFVRRLNRLGNMDTSFPPATLADAQGACSKDNLKAWPKPDWESKKLNEEECSAHVETTLNSARLCNKKRGGTIRDLEQVKQLFAPSPYKSLAQALKATALAKLGLEIAFDTGTDKCSAMRFCYRCSEGQFASLACEESSGCREIAEKPSIRKQSMMLMASDFEDICANSKLHATTKECQSYLARMLAPADFCKTRRILKLTEMTNLISPS